LAFTIQEPLQRLSQIGNQMIAICDLDSVWGSLLCPFRIAAGTVATYHLDTEVLTQPLRKGDLA
jgi:hypothetical protein